MTNTLQPRKRTSKNQTNRSGNGITSELVDGEDRSGTSCSEESGTLRFLREYLTLINLSNGFGVLLCVVCGVWFTWYLGRMHENFTWFTGIKPLQRELSFRTESGLYYSYYKQMINAPSISQGLYELRHDNRTEHLNTVNILQRFNVYQEVFLSILYRMCSFLQVHVEAEIFYVRGVFMLYAGEVWALYLMTWQMSGSWLAAFLSVVFYTFNKDETTRAALSVPLRESFALPFLYIQLAIITYFLKPSISKNTKKTAIGAMFLATFLFALTWQFAQFVLLLQAFALFGVGILEVVSLDKVCKIFYVQAASLMGVCVCQHLNIMVFNSLTLSYIPAALIIFHVKRKCASMMTSSKYQTALFFMTSVLYAVSSLVLMFIINTIVKIIIRQEADSHIYKFVMIKLGLGDPRDFDVRLYICTVSFLYMTWEPITRMTLRFIFPLYVTAMAVVISLLATGLARRSQNKDSNIKNTIQQLKRPRRLHKPVSMDSESNSSDRDMDPAWFTKRPELVYHSIQSVIFGLLAISTVRFKYLWGPYICVLASVAVSDYSFWRWLLSVFMKTKIRWIRITRHVSTLTVLLALIATNIPVFLWELKYKTLFSNPPLEELVTWINDNTDPHAAFSGDMALLASVKLCTGRPVTNHPHYEDAELRRRTKNIYQIYAKRHPKEIHQILRGYDASYVILEERHCVTRKEAFCAMPHSMDVVNGVIPESGPGSYVGLERSHVPRFCEALAKGKPEYTRMFKLMFHNEIYRVYAIMK